MDTTINKGIREQTKQGMLRRPVGAIAPGGSSCVSMFKKRIIGTAMYRKPTIFSQENEGDSVDGMTIVSAIPSFFSTGFSFL